MTVGETEARPGLDQASRARLAEFADLLISGGAGMPTGSEAGVQGKWIDRTLAARPDLVESVESVLARPGDPKAELAVLRQEDPRLFERFAYAIAGSYLMNPRVRRLLGLPGNAPKPKPAYPDESDHYLEGGILDPVIQRGAIYRPTPTAEIDGQRGSER